MLKIIFKSTLKNFVQNRYNLLLDSYKDKMIHGGSSEELYLIKGSILELISFMVFFNLSIDTHDFEW